MQLRSILVRSAFAALALLVVSTLPVGPVVRSAEAATSISVDVFYNELAPYGEWVWLDRSYVFVPADLDEDWRPYTLGHWVYADDYGWTWISDEPFGWATFHYGRWGYGEEIGWYWVPGDRWAPAWVSWRRSHDHIVWCPLPPVWQGDDLAVSIAFGDIPDFYWVAVPTVRFLDVDLRIVAVDQDIERRRILDETDFIGTVRVRNDIVVNNVININVVEKATGKRVKKVRARTANDPRQAKSDDNEVRVFPGRVEQEKRAKPSKVSDLQKLKGKKRGKRQWDQPKLGKSDKGQFEQTNTGDKQLKGSRDRTKVSQPETEFENADQTVRANKRSRVKATDLSTQSALPGKRNRKQVKPRSGQPSAAVSKLQQRGKKPIAKSVDDAGQAQKSVKKRKQVKPRSGQSLSAVSKLHQRGKKPIEESVDDAGQVQKSVKKRKQVKPRSGQSSSAVLRPGNRPKKGISGKGSGQGQATTGEQAQQKKKVKAGNRNNRKCDPSVNPDCAAQ